MKLSRQHARMMLVMLMTVFTGNVSAKNSPPTHYQFNESETVPVVLSSVDINRLVVKNDKITSIDCPAGFCVVTSTKTDSSGAARVSLNLAAPFTAYISTAKGLNFGLFITPKAKPAVTSIFTAQYTRAERASSFDKQSPYTSMMTDFTSQMIRYLATGEPIDGYRIHVIDNTKEDVKRALDNHRYKGVGAAAYHPVKKQTKPTGLTSEPAVVFSGQHFNGIIYRLTNHSPQAMTLTTSQFYSPTTRAAALSTPNLKSHQVAHLFVVSGGEAMR